MKRVYFITLCLVFPLLATAQKNKEQVSFTSAIEYNDYIVDRMDTATGMWTLAIEEPNMQKALKWTTGLKNVSANGIKLLNNLVGFNGDNNFKNSAINYLQHLNKISKKELPEFIKIIRKKGELTQKENQRSDELIPVLDDVRESLFNQVEKAQYAFADDNQIEIEGRTEKDMLLDYTEKNNFTDAAEYHDYLVDMVDIIDNYWTLVIEIENKETALAYNDTLKQRTEKILNSLKKLEPFEGYDGLREKVAAYAIHMNKISKNELKEFIIIIRSEEITTDGEQRAEALIPILDDEREELYGRIEKEQNVMADKFGFTITK